MNNKCANCGYTYDKHYDDGKCPLPVIRHSEPIQDMADARKAAEATGGLVKVPEHVVVSLPRPLTAKSMSNAWKHGYRTGSKDQQAADIAKVEAVRAVWSAKRSYLDVANVLSACDDILKELRGMK